RQFTHHSTLWIELPTEKSTGTCTGASQWPLIGIVGEIFFHSHLSVAVRFLIQVLLPGLLGSNLEDHVGRRPSLAHAPTLQLLQVLLLDAFDDRNIWDDGRLHWVIRLVEVK